MVMTRGAGDSCVPWNQTKVCVCVCVVPVPQVHGKKLSSVEVIDKQKGYAETQTIQFLYHIYCVFLRGHC